MDLLFLKAVNAVGYGINLNKINLFINKSYNKIILIDNYMMRKQFLFF